jgi:hypothetical protein
MQAVQDLNTLTKLHTCGACIAVTKLKVQEQRRLENDYKKYAGNSKFKRKG